MYIAWQWMKTKLNFPSERSLEELVATLNYLGLECEEVAASDPADSFINFTTASNRCDLKSWWGIQREVAILLNIRQQQNIAPEILASSNCDLVQVQTSKVHAYNFLIIEIDELAKQTPPHIVRWLTKNQFKTAHPLVDLANFITLETGQPLHVYDLDKIPHLSATNPISVRELTTPSSFDNLQGNRQELLQGDLVVEANGVVICLAGIIGGQQTAVTNSTRRILVEMADFDRETIDASAKRVGMVTRSSEIFRKRLNQESLAEVLPQVAKLFTTTLPCKVINACYRQSGTTIRNIKVAHELIEKRFGTTIEQTRVLAILKRLQFPHQLVANQYIVEVPSFRVDVIIEEDLIEEIGKLFDYNQIEGRLPTISSHFSNRQTNFKYELKKKISLYLNSWGYQELISYSLVENKVKHDTSFIEVTSSGNSNIVYRKSFLASHLKILSENLKQQNEALSFFEIGSIFSKSADSVLEEELLFLLNAGLMLSSELHALREEKDFYWLKGIVENILTIAGLENYRLVVAHQQYPGASQTSELWIGMDKVGFLGQVDPALLTSNQVSNKNCFFAQLSIAKILELSYQQNEQNFSTISYLPVIKKDISFVIAKNIKIDGILSLIEENGGEFFRGAKLFDKYQKHPQDSEHSLAFRLLFQGRTENLYNKDVEKQITKILNCLKKEFAIEER